MKMNSDDFNIIFFKLHIFLFDQFNPANTMNNNVFRDLIISFFLQVTLQKRNFYVTDNNQCFSNENLNYDHWVIATLGILNTSLKKSSVDKPEIDDFLIRMMVRTVKYSLSKILLSV